MKTETEIREMIVSCEAVGKAGLDTNEQTSLVLLAAADALRWVLFGRKKGNGLHEGMEQSLTLVRAEVAKIKKG